MIKTIVICVFTFHFLLLLSLRSSVTSIDYLLFFSSRMRGQKVRRNIYPKDIHFLRIASWFREPEPRRIDKQHHGCVCCTHCATPWAGLASIVLAAAFKAVLLLRYAARIILLMQTNAGVATTFSVLGSAHHVYVTTCIQMKFPRVGEGKRPCLSLNYFR